MNVRMRMVAAVVAALFLGACFHAVTTPRRSSAALTRPGTYPGTYVARSPAPPPAARRIRYLPYDSNTTNGRTVYQRPPPRYASVTFAGTPVLGAGLSPNVAGVYGTSPELTINNPANANVVEWVFKEGNSAAQDREFISYCGIGSTATCVVASQGAPSVSGDRHAWVYSAVPLTLEERSNGGSSWSAITLRNNGNWYEGPIASGSDAVRVAVTGGNVTRTISTTVEVDYICAYSVDSSNNRYLSEMVVTQGASGTRWWTQLP